MCIPKMNLDKSILRLGYIQYSISIALLSVTRYCRKEDKGREGKEGRQTIYHLALIGTATY